MKKQNTMSVHRIPAEKIRATAKSYIKYRSFVLMFLPVLIYLIVFKYIPMFGNVLAFKDFKFKLGIFGSEWVGFEHFIDLFSSPSFLEVFRNTLIISFSKLLVNFPCPIIFAILLNEIRGKMFKKCIQTVSYLPHFVSWVILAGIFKQFLSPSTGPINILLSAMHLDTIYFLGEPSVFRFTLVITSLWKSLGWGAIVYLAALTSIDPGLYEAAEIDGANRLHKILYITVPSLAPVMTIMFILSVGKIMNDDFDQIYNLLTPAVYSTGDVIGTFSYRRGIVDMSYEFSTAVGLFQNVISFVLVVITNTFANKVGENGIW